ncbi:10046_t:CDS:2, partial [Ambispora gerdemannii]
TDSDVTSIPKRLTAVFNETKHEIISSIPSLSDIEARLDVELVDRTVGQLTEFSRDKVTDVVPVLQALFDMTPSVYFTEDGGEFCILLRPIENSEYGSTWATFLVDTFNLIIGDRAINFQMGKSIEQLSICQPVLSVLILAVRKLTHFKQSYQSSTIHCISDESKQLLIMELNSMDMYIDGICNALSNETTNEVRAFKSNLCKLANKIEDLVRLLGKIDQELDDALNGIKNQRRNWTVGSAASTVATAAAFWYFGKNWKTLSRTGQALAGGITLASATTTAGCVYMHEDLRVSIMTHKHIKELLREFGRDLEDTAKCADFNLQTKENNFRYRKSILNNAFDKFRIKIDEVRLIGELNLIEQISKDK